MRLDFNVLWVDDQPDRVKAQINRIKKDMQVEGFSFAPRICRSLNDVLSAIADSTFADEIDLILVDWDLGQGVKGQDAIASIRDNVQYKDVVFYSAQTNPEELRKLAFEKQLEGVYCASREELVDEVMGVFNSLVKKVLDLDHTRGIIMGATSDIDHIVQECLIAIQNRLDGAGKEKLLKKARGYVKKRMDYVGREVQRLEGAAKVEDFFDAHIICTASDWLRMLYRALEEGSMETCNEYGPTITAYREHVVPDRNIFGHMVLVPDGKPNCVVDNKGKLVTLEGTRTLRRKILELRGHFRKLLLELQTPEAPAPAKTKSGGAK